VHIDSPVTDSPTLRKAGRDLLSLALIDARNRTLRLHDLLQSAVEAALAAPGYVKPSAGELNPPLWVLGHIGWYQEVWIARNIQRQRGERCDATAAKLASIEPNADDWYDPKRVSPEDRWQLALPDAEATRHYLLETLNTTLELLEGAAEDDDALYFYRLALLHEDRRGETIVRKMQTLDFDGAAAQAKALQALVPQPAPRALREPILFPATRWMLGMAPGGLVFDAEKWAHAVAVPEFEIDAQAVSWSQYSEFVEDGGYDEPRWWTPSGLDWLKRSGRRTPRHVEQMRQGVLARRYGQLLRVPMTQPAVHVNCHEAEAWCRWAGRRLPTEVEWEIAAATGASRGWRWGEVWEWTASPLRPYPGFVPGPGSDTPARFGIQQAVRGASFATRARLHHPKARLAALPERDDCFIGFRSCAV